MAEILQGNSEHAGYAPLSQAQTIAICKHLQQEIRQVEQSLGEVQRELQHTNENMLKIKEKASEKREDIHELRVWRLDITTRLEKMFAEQGRTAESVAALQEHDQASTDKITVLEEGNKLIEMKLGVLARDMTMARQDHSTLKAQVDMIVDEDIATLRKDADNTLLKLDQSITEQKKNVEVAKQDREVLRQARIDIESLFTETKKTNTVASILEKRLANTAKGVQETWAKCKELDLRSITIQECYDKTRGRVSDNEARLKELRDIDHKVQHDLEETVRKLETCEDKLAQTMRGLENEGTNTQELRHLLNMLRQSHDKVMKSLMSVQLQVKALDDTTQAVKAGLKEHSSLLLPNINIDSPEVVQAAVGRHGSLIYGGGTFGVRSSPKGGGGGMLPTVPDAADVWK